MSLQAADTPRHNLLHTRNIELILVIISLEPAVRQFKLFGLFLLAALVLNLLGTLCGQEPDGYRRAVELQRSGNLSAAIAAYRDFLLQNPGRFDARSNLGAALSQLGQYQEAISEYQKALAGAPPEVAPRLRQNLAIAFYKSGRLEDAARELEGLRAGSTADINIVLLLADSYLQLGRPQDAARVLLPSADAHRDELAFAYTLGTALIRSGQTEQGQAYVDRILRAGDSAEAHLLLGSSMFQAGDFPGAVREFRAALDRNSALPQIHGLYGRALLNTGDPDQATLQFQAELQTNPNDYEANFGLGEIRKQRAQWAEAETLLRKATQVRPGSADAAYAYADLLVSRRQDDAARAELKRILGQWPTLASAHGLLAVVLARAGNNAEAARERQLAAKYTVPIAAHDKDGPAPGSPAPDFALRQAGSDATVSLKSMLGSRPVLLVFGSYTCPNLRQQAPVLNRMHQQLGGQVRFLQVYIREAHAENWQSTINEREGVHWGQPADAPQKTEHALACSRLLKFHFPAVVDSMDHAVEDAYAAAPSRVYLVSPAGKVLFRTRLSEFDFHADELTAAIKQALR